MNHQLIQTADGSLTLFHERIGEHYHSKHGAVQESRHVFLNAGLVYSLETAVVPTAVSVLEVGFGTGLNFLLSAEYCLSNHIRLVYCGIEAFPLEADLMAITAYGQYVSLELWEMFIQSYQAALARPVFICPDLNLTIAPVQVLDYQHSGSLVDIIYFDAFGAARQPEMWSLDVLAHVSQFLKPGGIFVTYAITGNLKRNLKVLGFSIEKLPGAPGKREMLRALKKAKS